MNYFDDEGRILEHLQLTGFSYAVFPESDKDANQVLLGIMDIENKSGWVNTSGKRELPPDYICKEQNLMMEVMRVDDHARIGKKGIPVNPTNTRESQLQKEWDSIFPGTPKFINAISDLKGLEDHNYRYYIENFQRVVNRHKERIPSYRNNKPDYRLIFYVCDESSLYMEADDALAAQIGIRDGQRVVGRKHLYPLDKNMMCCLGNCDIDFLIWHTPFKRYFYTSEADQLPKVCIINLHTFRWETLIDYRIEHMMSMEE